MNYLDLLCDEEIEALSAKVESAQAFQKDINLVFKQTNMVRASLETSNDFINRKDYINGYKSFLHAMNLIININEQLVDKYTQVQDIIKDTSVS
jgi:benzoyl-CoA reductase/2-hydroxyglutaryl-CoA dehydratase subunit BcrC/BadD/HgdB